MIGIGSPLHQESHHGQVAAVDGENQRRLAAAVGRIDLGTDPEQQPRTLDPAELGSEREGSIAFAVADLGVGALAEKKAEPGPVASPHDGETGTVGILHPRGVYAPRPQIDNPWDRKEMGLTCRY